MAWCFRCFTWDCDHFTHKDDEGASMRDETVQLVYDLVDQLKAMRSVLTQGDDEVSGPLDDYTQAIVTDADTCIVEGQRFLNAHGVVL